MAAVLVWLRPRLGTRSWSWLAAVFVVVDVGLMGVTSQLTATPPNDLVAGTTPIEKLMAAKLPPGGRLVNYDPQTYASYPGSPQGVPDLNIIPGLPSISGYASIVNGNYESTTHTHEQDDLDIGQLASGTLGRLDLREVVTVPEYFLVPLQSHADLVRPNSPRSPSRSAPTPCSPAVMAPTSTTRRIRSIRVLVPPSQQAARLHGSSASLSSPASASLVLERPAPPGTTVRFGALRADGSTRWGAACPSPRLRAP